MEQNYRVNGVWFKTLEEAQTYSDNILATKGVYYVVLTKAEIESITQSIDQAVKLHHEQECGK